MLTTNRPGIMYILVTKILGLLKINQQTKNSNDHEVIEGNMLIQEVS